jgi:HSP20 family protein
MFHAPTLTSRFVSRPSRLNGYSPAVFDSFDRLFDTFASDALSARGVQVTSDEKSVTLQIDVPGLAKDQLTLAIEDNVVRIASKDDAPRRFKAAYQLAHEIDTGASEAKLENGVLTLKLAKKVPESRETVLAIQ